MKSVRTMFWAIFAVLVCACAANAQRVPEPDIRGGSLKDQQRRRSATIMAAELEERQRALDRLASHGIPDNRPPDPGLQQKMRINESLANLQKASEELLIASLGANDRNRKEISGFSKLVAKHSKQLREYLSPTGKAKKLDPEPLPPADNRQVQVHQTAKSLSELVEGVFQARSEILYTVQSQESDVSKRLETIEKQALGLHELAKK